LVLSAFWRHLQQASVDMPAALILLYPMRMMVAVSEIRFAANVSKGYAIFELGEQAELQWVWVVVATLELPCFCFC
jgi:hypothetical protein